MGALFCGESFDNDYAPSAFNVSNISNIKWKFRKSCSSYPQMGTGHFQEKKEEVSKQIKIKINNGCRKMFWEGLDG